MFLNELVGLTRFYRCQKPTFVRVLLLLVMFLTASYFTVSRMMEATRGDAVYRQFSMAATLDNMTAESTKATSHNNSPVDSNNVLSVNGQTLDSEFLKRRRVVEDACTSVSLIPGHVKDVFSHPQTGVLYCAVAKSGCTFWKRVFYFVNHQASNSSFKSPFDISRHAIHSFSNYSAENYSKLQHGPQNYPIRFMVTRDPMSRVIASYLDKLYLPDFWPNVGKQFVHFSKDLHKLWKYIQHQFDDSNILNNRSIFRFKDNLTPSKDNLTPSKDNLTPSVSTVSNSQARVMEFDQSDQDFMKKHLDNLAVVFNYSLNQTTSDDDKCGKFVTFSDFVTMNLYYPNRHWDSVFQLCDPCQFLPTHILHMETFSADAKVILSQLGLDHLLDNFDSVAQINEELTIIVNYHFKVAFNSRTSSLYRDCITARELAFRLYHSFQWKGYIHPHMEYSLPSYTDTDKVQENLMSQIWRARQFGLRQPELMKTTKEDFAQKLISSLSQHVLEELLWKYRLDYHLFGYKFNVGL